MRHYDQDDIAIHLASSWDNLVLVRARVSVSLSLSPSPVGACSRMYIDIHTNADTYKHAYTPSRDVQPCSWGRQRLIYVYETI